MSSFAVITRVPIPASLPPAKVIATLQTCEPLITTNPYLERFERRPVPAGETANDPFFTPANGGSSVGELQGFMVYERVPIIPGVGQWATKLVTIPCVFQTFDHGVRCRGQADGGVTVRSSYEVRRRGEVKDGPELVVGPGEEGEYELLDISSVECGVLVKPFVKMRFSSGHLAILKQVVADSMKSAAPQ
ncbi:hypothetical protein VTK26DRAFT_2533 [Humicola hyalothermophila]